MENIHIPVITIDGPTASGKGTVAQLVANKLGFAYLDSGALYRLTALAAFEQGVQTDDLHNLVKLAKSLPCQFEKGRIFLDGQDVTDDIRAEDVGNTASRIAILPEVRQALYKLQLSFRKAPGLVADGRDMGTVIFPEASLKVFLTASAEARAKRRYKQLIDKGFSASMGNILSDLKVRDERDMNRAMAPLKAAKDAYILDTSDMGVDDAVNQVLAWYANLPPRV